MPLQTGNSKNSAKRQLYTTVLHEQILANIRLLAELGADIFIRIPLIDGINADLQKSFFGSTSTNYSQSACKVPDFIRVLQIFLSIFTSTKVLQTLYKPSTLVLLIRHLFISDTTQLNFEHSLLLFFTPSLLNIPSVGILCSQYGNV